MEAINPEQEDKTKDSRKVIGLSRLFNPSIAING
jgi:hypothetical protein